MSMMNKYTSLAVSNFGSKHFDMSALRAAFDGCKAAAKHDELEKQAAAQAAAVTTGGAEAVEEAEAEEGDKKKEKKPFSVVEPGSMLWGETGSTGLFVICRVRSDVAELVLPPKQPVAEEDEETEGRKSGRKTRRSKKEKEVSIYPRREIVCNGVTLKIQELGYDLSTTRPESETQADRRKALEKKDGGKSKREPKGPPEGKKKPRKEQKTEEAVALTEEAEDETDVGRGKRQRDTEEQGEVQAEAEAAPPAAAPSPPKPIKKFSGDCCKFCGAADHLSRQCKNKSGGAAPPTPVAAVAATRAAPVAATRVAPVVAATRAPTPPAPSAAKINTRQNFADSDDDDDAVPAPPNKKQEVAAPSKNKSGGAAPPTPVAVAPVPAARPTPMVVAPVVVERKQEVAQPQQVQPAQRPSSGPPQSRSSGKKAKGDDCKHCGSADHLSRHCKNK